MDGEPFGHVKGEWPHLETITDPAVLDTELAVVREQYNTVRLHAAIGYVTPDDEHEGRGEGCRQRRRRDGMALARQTSQLPSRATTRTTMNVRSAWLAFDPARCPINSDSPQRVAGRDAHETQLVQVGLGRRDGDHAEYRGDGRRGD